MTDAREQLAKALDSSGDAGADWSEVQADAIDEFVEERDDAVKVAIAVLIHNRNVQCGKTVDAITQRLEAVERRLQHGLSCCCPLCRKSWGWTPCENHGAERCIACYPEQPTPAVVYPWMGKARKDGLFGERGVQPQGHDEQPAIAAEWPSEEAVDQFLRVFFGELLCEGEDLNKDTPNGNWERAVEGLRAAAAIDRPAIEDAAFLAGGEQVAEQAATGMYCDHAAIERDVFARFVVWCKATYRTPFSTEVEREIAKFLKTSPTTPTLPLTHGDE